jgi:hypothetical protein
MDLDNLQKPNIGKPEFAKGKAPVAAPGNARCGRS